MYGQIIVGRGSEAPPCHYTPQAVELLVGAGMLLVACRSTGGRTPLARLVAPALQVCARLYARGMSLGCLQAPQARYGT